MAVAGLDEGILHAIFVEFGSEILVGFQQEILSTDAEPI
jgi:hypothetical protein